MMRVEMPRRGVMVRGELLRRRVLDHLRANVARAQIEERLRANIRGTAYAGAISKPSWCTSTAAFSNSVR